MCDFLKHMSPDDWARVVKDMDNAFDLDTFVSIFPDDMNDVIEVMSPDEWEQSMEDVDDPFDLDDFVS